MTTPAPLPPLLVAENLRVDRDGYPLCEELSFNAHGERVVLAGAGATGIADAITLQGVVSKGQLRVDGHDVASRRHVGRVGLALLDPPLPPRMTVYGYISLGFQTAGLATRAANAAATSSLETLGLVELSQRRTESLALHERRATALAAAMLPDARSVVTQSPLLGLEGPASHYLLAVLGHLSKHRNVLATTTRYDASGAERDLIMGATHIVILDRSDVLWSGSSAALVKAGSMLAIRVDDHAEAFVQNLTDAGWIVHGQQPRFAVSIPAGEVPSSLLAFADQVGTTILEMIPLVSHPPPAKSTDSQPGKVETQAAEPAEATHPTATSELPSQE